jgi:hypothetical protein
MPKRPVVAPLALLLAVSLTLLFSVAAFGQSKKKAPAERAVSGFVTDASGMPVPGAIVQLENTKTQEVRSFIAKDKGDYYFHGLATDVDYRLKAQSSGHESAWKTLSSFDAAAEAKINLQLK